MKLALPVFALSLGFLLGHGAEMAPDLFVLLGAIVVCHIGFFAMELRGAFSNHEPAQRHIPAPRA